MHNLIVSYGYGMTEIDPPSYPHLDQQLCFPIYAAGNLITRLYRPILSPMGLTYPQYLVMLVLWEDGQVTIGHLGQRLYLDSGTLTPLLKRMEANGLVSRHRDPADERRVLVAPTETGMALREDAASVPEALACRVLDSGAVDSAALKRLRDELQSLVRVLNVASAHSGMSEKEPDL